MMYRIRFAAALGSVLLVSTLTDCVKREVNEEQARQAAVERIETVQSVLKFDAKRLPPLAAEKTADGFVFKVRDRTQNISLVVHVTKSGLAELSSLSLDEEQRRHEAGVRAARAPASSPPTSDAVK
jgi:hypothetical protein